jgi:hypothetical protein
VYDGSFERARNCRFPPVFARRIYNVESSRMLSYRMPFLLLLSMTACAASQSAPVEPWRVTVTSSGGLTGRGAGTYSIGSDGVMKVTTVVGKTCSFTATAEEIARVGKLLGAATPERWRESYLPEDTCCDRIEWTLTAEEGDRTFTTKWLDQAPPMPADLTALGGAIAGGGAQSLRLVYEPRCREESR